MNIWFTTFIWALVVENQLTTGMFIAGMIVGMLLSWVFSARANRDKA